MKNQKWIEALLFRGFLVDVKKLGNLRIVFKSLNQHEHSLIQILTSTELEKLLYTLAYSVFLFGSINVLKGNREENIETLVQVFSKLNKDLITRLTDLSFMSYLESSAIEDLSEYSQTDSSKIKYLEYKATNLPLNHPTLTGIPGTENLGLNLYQSQWLVLMEARLKREQQEEIYEWVKFLGAFINPEAVKKLNQIDKQQEILEQDIGFEIEDEYLLKKPIKTTQDLIDEVEKSIKGEMDIHDKIIAEAERMWIKEEYEKYKKRMEQRKKESNLEPGVFGESRVIHINDVKKKSLTR